MSPGHQASEAEIVAPEFRDEDRGSDASETRTSTLRPSSPSQEPGDFVQGGIVPGAETPHTNTPAHGTGIRSTPRRQWSSRSQPTPRTSKRIVCYRQSIDRLRTNLFRERKRKAVQKKCERRQLAEISQKYLPTSAHKLLMAQLKLSQARKYGRRWSSYMKDFALSLYYHGPRAYRFLRKTLCLPSVRSLISWQKKVVVMPGIDNNAMVALEEHAKNLTGPDLIVSIIFDEVAIRENLFYDPSVDRILGYCDYGNCVNSTVGNQCLVVMVKGITKKWKQCIGYWITHNSTDADVLRSIVLDCIHWSMRNNLARYDFSFNGNVVQWCHLRSLFDMSDPLKLKMIPKITKFHVTVKAFKKINQIAFHPFKMRYAMGCDTPHIQFLQDAKHKLERRSLRHPKTMYKSSEPGCLGKLVFCGPTTTWV
ncbi:uncharacterized protein LOC124168752 [Ischnura elegans]|uniref:uncharacterized protein LOC124168752 n=1 Tax=Ischnura elegans TaxID=197161 RepID=UPI001ED89167|nr:uncharacterized protein LOC124168752 [Ischnura elegans]